MAHPCPAPSAGRCGTWLERRQPAECTFFHHAHANVAEPFVSHSTWDSAILMLTAAANNVGWAGASAAASAHGSADATTDLSSAVVLTATAEPSRVAAALGESNMQQRGNSSHMTAYESSALTERASCTEQTPQSGTATLVDTTATTAESDSHATALPPPPSLRWSVPRHARDNAFVRHQRALLAHRVVMAKLNPLLLPSGAYTSVVASCVEYTRLTCCYRTLGVPCEGIVAVWRSLVRAALLCILHPDEAESEAQLIMQEADTRLPVVTAAHGRGSMVGSLCSVITGAYIHRIGANAFEVAVVMVGGYTDERHVAMRQCFSHWCGVELQPSRTALPIGAALRCVSLHLRWTPQKDRVTPGAVLPPIVAYVRSGAVQRPPFRWHGRRGGARYSARGLDAPSTARAAGDAASSPFLAYNEVRLFLARPVTSQLRGTIALRLPNVSTSSDSLERSVHHSGESSNNGYETLPPPPPPHDAANSDASRPVQPRPLAGAQDVARLRDTVTEVVCRFANVSVTAVGEHLVASELRPTAAYIPFVPTLCANVPPFLVVGPDEA